MAASRKQILYGSQMRLTLKRLALALIENHQDFSQSCLIGLQPRGVKLAETLSDLIFALRAVNPILGVLDVTFYRDDYRQKTLLPNSTKLNFSIDGKKVIVIDDVLYTGRSVRSGLDALNQFGRPLKTELLVLVDRRFSREVPIQPDYTGIVVDAVQSEKITVQWAHADQEDAVMLYS